MNKDTPMIPTGWIAVGPNGQILHFSVHDGWQIEVVTMEPIQND